MSAIYIELGREAEAKARVDQILEESPGTTVEVWPERLPYKNQPDLNRMLSELSKAGMT